MIYMSNFPERRKGQKCRFCKDGKTYAQYVDGVSLRYICMSCFESWIGVRKEDKKEENVVSDL